MTYWLNPDRSLCSFSSLFDQKPPIFPFLGIYPRPWMHHPTILTTTPIFFWFFFSIFYTCFSSRNENVSIFANAHWILKTVPSQHHHQSIPVFFLIFSLFYCHFSSRKAFFPYLEVCTGPWNSTHPSPVMTTIPIFFVIFLLFYWYFSFSIPTLSKFGNVCWTLKTMPNMVTNHPLFFSPFSSWFFHYFIAISPLA